MKLAFLEARKHIRNVFTDLSNEWVVYYRSDPASGKKTSVQSNDGMFRLQVEVRVDGSRRIGLYSQDDSAEFDCYGKELPVKFDGWEFAKDVEVKEF